MKKKILAFTLSLAMAAGLFAGCTGGSGESSGSGEVSPGGEIPATGMKIAIVTSPSGVDDGSFNQDNYVGIQNYIKENAEASVKDIRETDIDKSISTVEGVVADYDVIVTPGFQFGPITQVAMDNPEKSFILVDSFPSSIEDPSQEVETPVANIYAMKFAEEEGGFLAGVAAALETKTGKVAVVNGIAYPTNVNYQFGFESGVNYANEKFGTKAEVISLTQYAGTDIRNIEVGGNYIGTFDDEAQGKVVGEALIAEGVDIIFVAAGASGNGVFTAAKEGKIKVIGCDTDQYDDGVNGSENIILTSSLKVMNLNVKRALEAVAAGTFKGDNVILRADTDSIDYTKAEGRHQMSAETLVKMEEALDALKSGKVKPAANFSEYTSEDFPGLKD